jgi:hypothetical protein
MNKQTDIASNQELVRSSEMGIDALHLEFEAARGSFLELQRLSSSAQRKAQDLVSSLRKENK